MDMEPANGDIRVKVVGHRIVTTSRKSVHTVYTIRSTEDGSIWQVERRWSHVASLLSSIWKRWKPQLMRVQEHYGAPPKFIQHAYMVGSTNLDPALLTSRRRELEALLTYYISALHVSLTHEDGPLVLRLFLAEDSVDFSREGLTRLVPERRP